MSVPPTILLLVYWFTVCNTYSIHAPCATFYYPTKAACQDWEGGAGNFPDNPDLADPAGEELAFVTGDTGEYGGGCGIDFLKPPLRQHSSFIRYLDSAAFEVSFATPAQCDSARRSALELHQTVSRGCIFDGNAHE